MTTTSALEADPRTSTGPLAVDVLEQVDAPWWNGLVRSSDQGTVYQTTHWADYVRRYYRARPSYLVARENGVVRGLLLLFNMGKFPDRDERRPWQDHLKRPLNAVARVFRWYSGPVVFDESRRRAVLARLLEEVDALAERDGIWALDSGSLPMRFGEGARSVAAEAGFSLSDWATFVIDLTVSKETLWERLKASSARASVTRAMKLGLRAQDATQASFDAYARCEYEHGRAHGIAPWPRIGREALRDALAPAGAYRLFVAEHAGRMVAYTPVMLFHRTMHLVKPVQDPRCAAENIPAGDFLLWQAILFGHAQGLVAFDLAGVSPDPRTPAEHGIRFFKSKWGGEYLTYPVLRKSYRWKWLA